MKLQTEGHRWQDLSQDDRNFLYELAVSAIASAAIVVLLG
jgi:hypothetical protein